MNTRMILSLDPVSGSELVALVYSGDDLSPRQAEELRNFMSCECYNLPVPENNYFIIVISEVGDGFHCFSTMWFNPGRNSYSGGLLQHHLFETIQLTVGALLNLVHEKAESGRHIKLDIGKTDYFTPLKDAGGLDEVFDPKNWLGPGKHK